MCYCKQQQSKEKKTKNPNQKHTNEQKHNFRIVHVNKLKKNNVQNETRLYKNTTNVLWKTLTKN